MSTFQEDVVISGIGGYFPKALNVDEFKKRLFSNESLVEPKWAEGERGVCNISGFIPSDYFDNSYFGIHRQQCHFMDPMHRLALERTFEALIDAGVNPTEVRGKKIGVYIGSTIGENDNLFLESVVSGFGVTGHSRAMMPNRISYWLNLKGPSLAYDCNWVGGLEVLRHAYNSIRTGQCESVIVGTANLALHSEFQWAFNDIGVLSQDGSTRAFDANATGYARSDGVVILYIQKASEARRSYASIVHIATKFDGSHSEEFLAHNVDNMVEFMEEFYEKSPVKPKEVEYVETYGCAVKKTDERELEALEKIYCKDRKTPLPIGSVKTLTGHTESSAALVSLVSVLIAMEEKTIPATIQFDKPNPEIQALQNGSMEVVTTNKKWNAQYAAINALGLNSYYGHILLKANLKEKVPIQMDLPVLINISTRTEEGIKEILDTVKSKPKDPEFYKLVQDTFSKPIQGHLYRGYEVLGEEVKEETTYHMGNKREIWFVYSGMGSQWCGMLGDFMKIDIFANSIKKSHDILATRGVDLMNIITTKDKTIFDNILNCFVGIAAIQIALTDILKALEIVPDGIIGHSVGELGCAYADGCMTAEQMILSAYSRGRASVEATLIQGMMAAIGLGYDQVKNKVPPSIEVACHNGPESCTISGPTEDMEKFVKQLQDQGVFARLVNVANIAYHSRYIKPAAPLLLKYLKDVLPKPIKRSSKWVSTSNLQTDWDTHLAKHSSAEYHTNNLLSSVLFEEGCRHIPKDSILIEIAPHGLLQAILKRSVANTTNVPLTHRGSKSGVDFLLQSLGKLYLAGMDFKVSNIYPKIEYPVSRGTPSTADLVRWNHSENWKVYDLDDRLHAMLGTKEIQISMSNEECKQCLGHQLKDNIVLPTSYYLDTIFQIYNTIVSSNRNVVFENLHFRKSVVIPRRGAIQLHAMVQKGSGEFEVVADKDLVLTGRITFPQADDVFMLDPQTVEKTEENVELSSGDFYSELQHRGYKYSGTFKSLKTLTITETGSIGSIQWNNKWTMLVEAMLQQQFLQSGEENQEVHVPKLIQKIAISQTQLPTEKTDIQVDFDYATRMLSTEGIQIIGVTSLPLNIEENPLYPHSVEAIPLNNATFTKIEAGIEFAIQLTLNNFSKHEVNTIYISDLKVEQSVTDNIKNVINECLQINCILTTITERKQIVTQETYPQLIIVNDVVADNIFKIISSSSAFLLTKTQKNSLSYPDIVQIAQFNIGNEDYSIFRKANNKKVTTITVKSDTLSIKDLKRSSAPWVSELHTAVEDSKLKSNSVFLIAPLIPLEGFNNFVQEIRAIPDMESIRIIFNLDKKTEDYTPIFKKNLIVSIIKGGYLHTYLPFSFKHRDNIKLNQTNTSLASNKTIKFLGINLRDETLNVQTAKKNELGNIDYAGITNTGERVMGIGYLDKVSSKFVVDPIFTWEVPENFSLEDATTVPHAYVSAYYMMKTKGRLRPGNTVLIHAGCSAIGLAAISIAAFHGCQVFTTISAHWQRAFLKKQFSFLRDRNILSSNDASFESDIKLATGGRGADIILNCVSGNLLKRSLACIADYGSFIQYGKYDLDEGNSIGMYCFLRNTSFYAVNLENVLIQSKEVKEEIKKMIDDGIEQFVVRPLCREIATHHDIPKMLSQLKKSTNIGKIIVGVDSTFSFNKLNVDKPDKFICNSKSTYLVHGGSAENWTDLVEWLVFHGAKKIVVSSDSKHHQNYINRRLSVLQTYYGVDIIMTSTKANTKEGATELLSEVQFLGPIHVVFTLPNKSNDSRSTNVKPVHYLDIALRSVAPKALFVNFVSAVAGICYIRAEIGFSTYNVQWTKHEDLLDGIAALDLILNSNVSNILVKKERVTDASMDTYQATFKDLGKLLPLTDDIIKDQKRAPEEPELVQVTTEGPLEIRELAPIFLIPGITGRAELEDLVKTLLYPTFCTVLPSKPWPLEKLAEVYVEKIRNIYPKKVYNIVSVSSGGVLAMEIARLLHKQDASLHLYFIDSAPTIIQNAFRQLGQTKDDMEVNILRAIFDINDTEILEKLKSAPNWESRTKVSMEVYVGTERNKKLLEDGLHCLNDRLESILAYLPNDTRVSGQIHLIRPNDADKFDTCHLTHYCEKPPKVTLVTGDHLSIISNRETSDYINKNHQLI